MLVAALVLIAVGLLMVGGAAVPYGFDFAVALRPGWHVVVFPPPLWLGVLLIAMGLFGLLASVHPR
jgi:hypothetical protein